MKVRVYRDHCTSGHAQVRPFSRNVAITWGTRTLRVGVHYNATGSIYICGACYL